MMFNDERINQVCGKTYSRGILLAMLYTVLFAVTRVLMFGEIRPSRFLTEAAILATGGIILLIGLIRWGFARDERAVFEKHNYYLTAGKVFAVVALAGYAVSIPLRMEASNDYPVNELILHLETLGCVYFFFAFKRNSVSFNYTFIDEPRGVYYRRVLLNIAKLAGILLVPFWGAAMLDLMMHQSFLNFLVILAGYAASVIGLGLDYLLLSALEKMNYDAPSPKAFKPGTRIAWLLVCVAVGITAALRIGQAVCMRFPLTEVGRVMMAFSTAINRWSYPTIIITALALCFLLEENLHSKRVRVGIGGFLAVQAVDRALRASRTAVVVFLERTCEDDYTVVAEFMDILSVLSFAVWLLSLVFSCLWIHGMVRDGGTRPTLWLTVILVAVSYLGGLLLQTVGTGILYAIVVGGGELAAWIWQMFLLSRGGEGEKMQNAEGRMQN